MITKLSTSNNRRGGANGVTSVAFSSIKPHGIETIRRLGGIIVDGEGEDDNNQHYKMTVLVAYDGKSPVKSRREKFVTAICLGIPIVSTLWLDHCNKENRFVDVQPFLIKDADAQFNLSHSLERRLNAQEHGGILHGLIVYLCPGEAGTNGLPSKEGYRVIVEACGATLLTNAIQLMKQDASKVVMIVNDTQSLGVKARSFLDSRPMVMQGRDFMDALLRHQFEFSPFVSEETLTTVVEVDDDSADDDDDDDDGDGRLVDVSSDTFQILLIRSILLIFATNRFNERRAEGTPIQIMKKITPKDYNSIDGLKQYNNDVVTAALVNPEDWMDQTYDSMAKVAPTQAAQVNRALDISDNVVTEIHNVSVTRTTSRGINSVKFEGVAKVRIVQRDDKTYVQLVFGKIFILFEAKVPPKERLCEQMKGDAGQNPTLFWEATNTKFLLPSNQVVTRNRRYFFQFDNVRWLIHFLLHITNGDIQLSTLDFFEQGSPFDGTQFTKPAHDIVGSIVDDIPSMPKYENEEDHDEDYANAYAQSQY